MKISFMLLIFFSRGHSKHLISLPTRGIATPNILNQLLPNTYTDGWFNLGIGLREYKSGD